MFELKVICKNTEKKYTQDFLLYDEDVQLYDLDPKLKKCIDEALQKFNEPEVEVTLKITMHL